MSDEQNIQVAKDFITSFNNSDWESFESILCPEITYLEKPTNTKIEGDESFLELCKGWKSVMSDCSGEVTNSIASADTVVLEITWTGTQSGPMQTPLGEHPSSGKFQKTDGVQIFKIIDGKITELTNYFDLLSMLMQFGAIG